MGTKEKRIRNKSIHIWVTKKIFIKHPSHSFWEGAQKCCHLQQYKLTTVNPWLTNAFKQSRSFTDKCCCFCNTFYNIFSKYDGGLVHKTFQESPQEEMNRDKSRDRCGQASSPGPIHCSGNWRFKFSPVKWQKYQGDPSCWNNMRSRRHMGTACSKSD